MKDIKQIIKERKELGNQIDHMHDIDIPDRRAYERAQARYIEMGVIIRDDQEGC